MSILSINGTFHNDENGTFTAKVGLRISMLAPSGVDDLIESVYLENEDLEDRMFHGKVFYNVSDVVLAFRDYFVVDWVESEKVDTVDLKDLVSIRAIDYSGKQPESAEPFLVVFVKVEAP